jgi:hypothetical protein
MVSLIELKIRQAQLAGMPAQPPQTQEGAQEPRDNFYS